MGPLRHLLGLFFIFIVGALSCRAVVADPARPLIPSDENGFTALAARGFQKIDPDSTVTIRGPLQLTIKKNGATWDTDLHVIYAYCQKNRPSCGIELALHIKQLAAAHTQLQPLQKSNLRIVVRPTDYVDAVEKHNGEGEDSLLEPLCGDLWAIVVEDQPTVVSYSKPAAVTAIGLSGAQALDVALANTKAAIARRIPAVTAEDKHNLSVFFGDDSPTTFAFPEL